MEKKKNKKKKEEYWWQTAIGVKGETRRLLYNMISSCFADNEEIAESKEFVIKKEGTKLKLEITFKNTFSSNKVQRTKSTFRDEVFEKFFWLCRWRNEEKNDSDIVVKAIKQVEDWAELKEIPLLNTEKPDNGCFLNCEYIKRGKEFDAIKHYEDSYERGMCIDRIKNGECTKCPFAWLYINLTDVEKNYESIMKFGRVMDKYKDKEDEGKVIETYDAIERIRNLSVSDEDLWKLFDCCRECCEIHDVKDTKLAYIKWYTAHLMTFPRVQSKLKEMKRYDETRVYELLQSASQIMRAPSIEKGAEEEELYLRIECERIVSHLSLAYYNPFKFTYLGADRASTFEIEVCKFENDIDRLEMYLHLWALYSCIAPYMKNVYEKKIEELCEKIDRKGEGKQKRKVIVEIEYYLYQYVHNFQGLTGKEQHISADVIMDKFKSAKSIAGELDEEYGDIWNSLKRIYFDKCRRDDSVKNPCFYWKEFHEDGGDKKTPVLNNPGFYRRILGDWMWQEGNEVYTLKDIYG